MRARITPLVYWKSEHDASTNEDALAYNPKSGLFAVADGVGSASFANIWSHILVNRFVQEPLMSDHPFEIEWWLRRAQDEYAKNKDTRPESVPTFAQEKAREGSKSTLVTVRFTQIGEESAQVILLAIGDSNALIAKKSTEEIEAFPLERASQFDARPLVIPTRLVDFDRDFQRCQTKIVTLHLGDTLVLATDAVSKWVLSQANPRDALDRIISITQEHEREKAWQEFIESCRKENTIIDDDSTALVIELTNPSDGDELGVTVTYSEQTIQEREEQFRKAQNANLKEWMAIYFGDGNALASRGIHEDKVIQDARQVADAVKELRLALSATVKTSDLTIAKRVWDKYSAKLQGEPSAETLIKSLKALNIPLEGPMPLEPLKPPEPVKQPESRQTERIGKPIIPKPVSETPVLPSDEKTRNQLKQFREVLARRSPKPPNDIVSMQDAQEIAETYHESLDQFLSTSEINLGRKARRIVEMTKSVRDAIKTNDDQSILIAYSLPEHEQEKEQKWWFEEIEWQRIYLARLRKNLAQGDDDQAVKIADEKFRFPSYLQERLTREERKRLDDAREKIRKFHQFQIACGHNDDEEICSAYDTTLEGYEKFTTEHRQRYELARKRLDALNKFRQALATKQDEAIVNAYVSDLKGYPKITPEERKQLENAQKRVQVIAGLKEALQKKNAFAIVQNADAVLLGSNVPEIHRNIEEIMQAFFTVGWLWRILDWAVQKDISALRGKIHEHTLMNPESMEQRIKRFEQILTDQSYVHILTQEQRTLLADMIPMMKEEIERAKKRQKKSFFGWPKSLFPGA